MQITTPLSRMAIGMCGAVVGAYCAFTAFRNGQALASGLDGIAFGSAFAAVVIGSWFLLPLAASSPAGRAALMRLGWALCLAFVLINAIGFTASHRTEKVGERSNTITAYDVALKGLQEASERLTAMKANPRWSRTSGCTDATAEQSIEFCRQLQQAQVDVSKHQPVITSGRPATADAQADTIAWATRIDVTTVSRAMPIFMAVVLDIAASLFIWTALTIYGQPQQAPIQEPQEAPKEEPKITGISRKPAAKKKASKPKKAKDWSKISAYSSTMTKKGKPDRRRKVVKMVNDNMPAGNDNVLA